MDVDLVAQQIRSYAASPTEDGLDELSKSFDACREEHVNLDDDIVRAEVLACVLKLSSAIQSQPQELRGWNCLCFLVSMGWCERSADTITAFASTSACGPLLAHCGTVISSSQVHDEIRFSFEFIYRFMVNTDTRREMVYNTVGLPGAVFRYLSDAFPMRRASCKRRHSMLRRTSWLFSTAVFAKMTAFCYCGEALFLR
jgi:hypothetical protein